MMKVAIIGGGPAGLAMAKSLAMEPEVEKIISSIDMYERRDKLGGLWYYTGDKEHVLPPVPSTTYTNFKEIYDGGDSEKNDYEDINKRLVSPMYKHLETNIVKQMMAYKGVPFPEKCERFPTRQEVWEYMITYSKTIPKIGELVNIKLSHNVESVKKFDDGKWELISKNLSDNGSLETISDYDYVIFAQGHFEIPFIPQVDGLKYWNEKSPLGSVSHAKYFNDCDKYKDKTVLIVGNSASGIDITTQLSTVAKKVIVSSNNVSAFGKIDINDDKVIEITRIKKYDYDNNKTIYGDEGEIESNIDYIIFCTGYLYSLPFLKNYVDPSKESENIISNDGTHLKNLYKHMFYIHDPTLIHICAPKNVIPMAFSESQAAYASRVITNRIKLPSEQDMLKDYENQIKLKDGKPQDVLVMKFPEDALLAKEYNDIVNDCKDGKGGFIADYWTEEKIELRKNTVPLKSDRLKLIVKHANKLSKDQTPFYLLRGDTSNL